MQLGMFYRDESHLIPYRRSFSEFKINFFRHFAYAAQSQILLLAKIINSNTYTSTA